MAKVKGPLLSISARGQIGKSQVYASWKGVPYARQHVTPNNPRTTAQTLTRNVFKSMDDEWKRLGPLSRAPWEAAVKGRPLTARNKVMSSNIPLLRGEADMAKFVASPGALGGLPPTNLVVAATASTGEIEFTVTSPQEPVGWTLDSITVQALKDRDPAVIATDFPLEDEDLAPNAGGDTVVTLTGADGGVLYQASAWLVWTRPDGVVAYGQSLIDSVTPLA